MKFRCGLRAHNKDVEEQHWHRKFTWLPTQVGDYDCRWLEFVERKRIPDIYRLMFRYRPIGSKAEGFLVVKDYYGD